MQETILKRAGQAAPATAPEGQSSVPGTQAAATSRPSDATRRKLFIRTFGCQMNEYDSDKMIDVLNEDVGIELTQTAEDADIILFNTCSVREKAQEKVFSDLGRVRQLKNQRPDLIIGVGGCVASQEGEAIIRRAPYVDVVFGRKRAPPARLIRERQMAASRRLTSASRN